MDVISFVISANDFINDPSWENAGWLAADVVGLLPVVPSAGIFRHSEKLLNITDDAIDLFRSTDKVVDGVKTVDKASEAKTTYQTYTKTNAKTGEVYSGRNSGTGTPKENVANRDKNHYKNKEGFGPAKVDKSTTNKNAAGGREQTLINKNGGAKSQGGTSGNSINGISSKNKNKQKYMDESKKEFGD